MPLMTSLLAIERTYVTSAAALIEVLAAGAVAVHVVWALAVMVLGRWKSGFGTVDFDSVFQVRQIMTDGVLAALSFSVAATLLKTIALENWEQIRTFAFVLVFRTLLKRVFQWEARVAAQRRRRLEVTA